MARDPVDLHKSGDVAANTTALIHEPCHSHGSLDLEGRRRHADNAGQAAHAGHASYGGHAMHAVHAMHSLRVWLRLCCLGRLQGQQQQQQQDSRMSGNTHVGTQR